MVVCESSVSAAMERIDQWVASFWALFNAVLNEPPPPFANRVLVDAEAFGNLLTLQSSVCATNAPRYPDVDSRAF